MKPSKIYIYFAPHTLELDIDEISSYKMLSVELVNLNSIRNLLSRKPTFPGFFYFFAIVYFF